MNKHLLYIAASFLLLSCGTGEIEEISQDKKDAAIKKKQYTGTIIDRHGIKLVEATDYPLFEDIELSLNLDNQRLKRGENTLELNAPGFNLGEITVDQKSKHYISNALGQHLTFQNINGEEVDFASTRATYDLKNGHNVVLAYLSRSYNMSLKGKKASQFFDININEDGGFETNINLNDTALFYLEPRGVFGTKTSRVLLDFYVTNVTLGKGGNYVSVEIDGEEYKVYKWKPFWVYGLTPGKHIFKLGLRNKSGEPLKGRYLKDVQDTIEFKDIKNY